MNNSNSTKLKVLFIAQNIPVPGIRPSRIIIDIAHQLSSFADLSFLYPSERIPFGFQWIAKYRPFYNLKKWNIEGFEISVSKYFRLPFKKAAFWCWNKLSKKDIKFYQKKGPFDLIHAHYLFPDGYMAYLFSKKYTVPYIITIRNADIRHLKRIGRGNPDFEKAKEIISNAKKVLSLNMAYKDFIDELFDISSVIVPHGIEEEAFYKDPAISKDKVKITVVAEFIRRKNIDWVIRAFKSYSGKKEIELNIIGDGPLAGELKHLAANDDRIKFHGKVPRAKVLRALQASDIFVLPSEDESFGLVYLEAAATSNAIIGLKDEGVWGVFKAHEEMLFCADEKELNKLLSSLIDDAQQREQLKQNAFSKASTLKWSNIVEQYKEIYSKAII